MNLITWARNLWILYYSGMIIMNIHDYYEYSLDSDIINMHEVPIVIDFYILYYSAIIINDYS
jgi:uncharacterized protein with PQ loop repeat